MLIGADFFNLDDMSKKVLMSMEEFIGYQMEQLDKQEVDLERHRVRNSYLKSLNNRQSNIISATRAGMDIVDLDVKIDVDLGN